MPGPTGSRRWWCRTSRRSGASRAAAIGRNAEQVAELLGPVTGAEVVEHGPAGVRRLGGVHLAAGQVPQQPRVDGPERQVVVDDDPARHGAAIPYFVSREVRVEHEAGRGPHPGELAGGGELVASPAVLPVLPHDGPVARAAGAAIPRHHGLPLVGDPDGSDQRGVSSQRTSRVGHHPGRRPLVTSQISSASCSTQPGRGEVLGELPVGRCDGLTRQRRRRTPGRRWFRRRWR